MGDSCLLSPPYSPHLPLRHVQRGSLQGRPLSSDSPAFPSHPIDSARLYFCDLIMHLPSALFCILYSAVYMYFDLPCSELLYIILSHPFSTPPVTSQLMFSNRAISITAPHLWDDLPPDLRTISLPPPPSLPITTHPPPLAYSSPTAFHSKLKCHLFKLSYPDPSNHSPSPPERHQP